MKTILACALILTQLFEAYAEVIFRQLTENESLDLSCALQQEHALLTGLHLYHRSSHSQTTLLSMAEGGAPKFDPDHKERLQLYGGLDSSQINVTMSHLLPSDTGLYMWELSFRKTNSSDQVILSSQKVLLLVEVAGRSCWCSNSYPALLLLISAAAGLLLLTLSCLAVEQCVKVKARDLHGPQPSAPIYEEMSRKQQSSGCGAPQNNHEAPSHLEEDNFPVYANPNIRQQQDNYYACPRQLALRA